MQLVVPDLFAEVSKLSQGALAIGAGLGFLIWVTGWWQHRFWTVVIVTASAGVVGLQSGREAGVQPLVAGMLAALSAGWMAIELAKVIAFLGGGLTCSLLIKNFVPNIHEPLIAFLAGGLVGVVLFRLWMMALTSFCGSLLMGYCGLALAQRSFQVDATEIVTNKSAWVSASIGGGVLIGMMVQARMDYMNRTADRRFAAKAAATLTEEERQALRKVASRNSGLGQYLRRRAG